MSEIILTRKLGFFIYGWLVTLTLLEVIIVYQDFPQMMSVIIMAGATLAKVFMIVLHFMHVKYDRPIAWLLPIIPLALAIFFVLVLFPDMVFHQVLVFK